MPIKLLEQLEYGNVLLVGDAAGCASPLHGGGIDTSFSVGRLAARWIAGREGRLTDGQLNAGKSFSAAVADLLRPKLRVEEKICDLWSQLDRPALDAVASLATRDCRQVRLWGALPSCWLVLGYTMAGYRLWRGLTRGRW